MKIPEYAFIRFDSSDGEASGFYHCIFCSNILAGPSCHLYFSYGTCRKTGKEILSPPFERRKFIRKDSRLCGEFKLCNCNNPHYLKKGYS